jgi:arylsulfatase A-like enzyme
MFLYRETTHVPLMVKLPGRHRRAGRSTVQHIDLAPTILDLVACGASQLHAGRSARCRGSGTLPSRIYSEALYARYHFGWSELYA